MGKSALTVQIRTCDCNMSTELRNYQTLERISVRRHGAQDLPGTSRTDWEQHRGWLSAAARFNRATTLA